MSRYIDVEHIPNDNFFKDLTDTEKAKVLSWFIQAPTADVEKVEHGHWHLINSDVGWNDFICSVCKNEVVLDEGIVYDYCPNCGAKMDGRVVQE